MPAAVASDLPIRQHEQRILSLVAANPVTIVIGETGCGKTTQLPQMLLDGGVLPPGGRVAVTQPRRVAAIAVARRVSEERSARLGAETGYAVRFDECSSGATRLKYLTDGTLLREMLTDPELASYDAVVLDEAHERSLNTDVLFALLKRLVVRRNAGRCLVAAAQAPGDADEADKPLDPQTSPQPTTVAPSDGAGRPLRLVVMSATMDADKLSRFFGDCPTLLASGRLFPVDLVYAAEDPGRDHVTAAAATALDIHLQEAAGDILVFLSGQAEVDKAVRLISEEVAAMTADECAPLLVLPLYAALPMDMQARVFVRPAGGERRCIVATNIAETSITIDGIVYVVDAGMCKEKAYDAASGVERLGLQAISRVQATQRAGRAGRTCPGKCFRLYTHNYFEREMAEAALPEIQRAPLLGVVLHLKSLPAELQVDVLAFEFVDPPGRDALEAALRQLHLLGAIDHQGDITSVGRQMVQIPLEPHLSRAILAAARLGCLRHVVTIAAMLAVESVFEQERASKKGQQGGGDGAAGRAEQERQEQKAELLAHLQADGAGDHTFLLRTFELLSAASSDVEQRLARVLSISSRSFSFVKKVRSQLTAIVEQRVWPLLAHESGADPPASREPRRSVRDNGSRRRGLSPEGVGSHGEAARGRPRCPDLRAGRQAKAATAEEVRAVRHALAIGFASKLARRMPSHNGYRTVSAATVTVASVHPECAELTLEDGLQPEWLVYHELHEATRVTLRKVCAVEHAWVQPALERLQTMDARRLATGSAAGLSAAGRDAEGPSTAGEQEDVAAGGPGRGPRDSGSEQKISDARRRALERASVGTGSRRKKIRRA